MNTQSSPEITVNSLPIGHAAHVRFQDMRQGFETNFFHQCPPSPRQKGGKLKLMRNGFTAGFGHFLGTKTNLEKKKH